MTLMSVRLPATTARTNASTPRAASAAGMAGYSLHANGHSCEDDDECALGTDACDEFCFNEPGTYSCSCSETATTINGGDGMTCQNLDECALGTDGCAHTCTDTDGSYTCGCDAGYTLNADAHSCDDVDECATNNGGCAGFCHNEPATYVCSCGEGYTIDDVDMHLCNDLDECADANENDCTDTQTCTNTDGGYTCTN